MNRRQFRRLVDVAFREDGVPRVAGEWVVEHENLIWYVELFKASNSMDPVFDFRVGAWVPGIESSSPAKANNCPFTFWPQSEPWTGPRILPPTTPTVTTSNLVVPLAFSMECDITDEQRAQQVRAYVNRLVAHLRSVSDVASLARAHAEGMLPAVVRLDLRSAFESLA